MSYALHNGLGEESEVPYHAKDIPCAKSHLEKVAVTGGGHHVGSTALGLTGFRTLPSNKQEPLMRAVAERGPVAVSASAHNWFEYKSGVFDACQKDAVVDHAITMYGYGRDPKLQRKYWLIRNSWGPDWGEHGFMRLLRRDNEDQWCGVDNDPKKGTGCDGGPSSVPVCGTCGIMFDSVVPHFGSLPAKRASGTAIAAEVDAEGQARFESPPAKSASGAAEVDAEGRVVRRHAEASMMRRG
jgi:hypothetical protein